ILRRVLRVFGGRRGSPGGNVDNHANETAGELREHFGEGCWIRRGPAWRRRLGWWGLARRRALRLLRRAWRRGPGRLGTVGRRRILRLRPTRRDPAGQQRQAQRNRRALPAENPHRNSPATRRWGQSSIRWRRDA